MSGFHRPVVVDTQLANFEDLRLTVHCVPGDLLTAADASALCAKVGTLFETQGAEVTTTSTLHGAPEDPLGAPVAEGEGDPEEEVPEPEEGPPPADLRLELRARRVHEANNLLSWAICAVTFTLVPATVETTFAQDVVVRDGTGFLLISDTMEGRLVLRFGAGTWIGNKIVDLLSRKDEDKLTGDRVNRDLSSDLYDQLSQTVFNAKMQWEILQYAPAGRVTRGR